MNNSKNPENITSCDLCHSDFRINSKTLVESRVVLHKDFGNKAVNHVVSLTSVICPHCGKMYPVVMDDETTLPYIEEVRRLFSKKVKYANKHKPIPEKLETKYQTANRKLDFKRQQLGEKFNGSFYQTEDGKEQLDYRYHTR